MFVNDNEYIASGNKFINKLNVPVSIYLLLVVAMKVCSHNYAKHINNIT